MLKILVTSLYYLAGRTGLEPVTFPVTGGYCEPTLLTSQIISICQRSLMNTSAPEGNRTPNPLVKSQVHLPIELQTHKLIFLIRAFASLILMHLYSFRFIIFIFSGSRRIRTSHPSGLLDLQSSA